jgi:pteridine reductase
MHDKVVFITGAARRVGAVIARQLHTEGARIVLHYRHSATEAQTLANELNCQRSSSAALIQGDLARIHDLPPMIEQCLHTFGQLDVLINNASSFYPTPMGTITETQWDDLLSSNLKAPLFLTQAAAPALRQSQGLVLNIVDIHGSRPLRDYPVYSTAKAGLIMLTRALARELAPQIRVNAIAPGPVLWPQDQPDDALQQKIIERTALKRAGSPEDIAKAVLFFATQAPFVTGQILAVDGGRSIGW